MALSTGHGTDAQSRKGSQARLRAATTGEPLDGPDLPRAVAAWRVLLGERGVAVGAEAKDRYGRDTDAALRSAPIALCPRSTEQVVCLVDIARQHRVPLHPVSTGRNWGYGTATPSADEGVLVDLSGMNRIVAFDAELGTVTVEPGVTQGDLRRFLDEQGLPFMVPTTGAGPSCSLLGNALERGYGVTPHADHFGAVMSLEAVLPEGRVYRSALAELGGEEIDQLFKWGLGPYVDGLFAQGGLGIVTRATIVLARVPEEVAAFYFWVEDDARLEAAVERVRNVLRSVGNITGSINLMNRRRILSMTIPHPGDPNARGEVLDDETVARFAKQHRVAAWTGMGTIYGPRHVVRAVRRMIRKEIRPLTRRLLFLRPSTVRFLEKLLRVLPRRARQRLGALVATLESSFEVLTGRPNEVALPLCYWRAGTRAPEGRPLDPARDGCGLLWYAPLVPMRPEAVRRYTAMVDRICVAHGIEPLITLTSVSDRCFDSTVPLLFDRDDPAAVARAHACYDALLAEGCKSGFLPYRVGPRFRDRLVRPELPFWQLATRIKEAVDPQHLIAPGRYALTRDETEEVDHPSYDEGQPVAVA